MKKVLILIAALMVLVACYGLYLAHDAGEFRNIDNRHPGVCRKVPGVAGGEDITIHPSGIHAYISSDDRRSVMAGDPVPGAIFRYPLDGEGAEPVNMTPQAGVDFRPHGISLYVGEDGRETLFVVNHPGESLFGAPASGDGPPHTIEVFDIAGDELVHRRTAAGDLMVSPNDVVAVDHERFYFTNDHGSRPGWSRSFEDYLRLPWANVVYHDGVAMTVAADGLSYANGINLSPDGGQVYVAEVTRGRIRMYDRDAETGALSHRRTIDAGFGADNIEVDPASGDLWIGGHLKLLTFVRHSSNAGIPSPSRVDRIRVTEHDHTAETVFVDDGRMISGASVGAARDDRLLIGSVFEPHIIDCRAGRTGWFGRL